MQSSQHSSQQEVVGPGAPLHHPGYVNSSGIPSQPIGGYSYPQPVPAGYYAVPQSTQAYSAYGVMHPVPQQQYFASSSLNQMVGTLLRQMIDHSAQSKSSEYSPRPQNPLNQRHNAQPEIENTVQNPNDSAATMESEEDSLSLKLFLPFQSHEIPKISINAYLQRIEQYSKCSECCFILALIYIDRLTMKYPNFSITAHNIHRQVLISLRLMLTSILVSTKFYDDIFYDNKYFSQIGGVSNIELNQLQIRLLHLSSFEITVSSETYHNYVQNLLKHFSALPSPSTMVQASEAATYSAGEDSSEEVKEQD